MTVHTSCDSGFSPYGRHLAEQPYSSEPSMNGKDVGNHMLKVGFWRSNSEPSLPDPLDHVDLSWSLNERRVVSSYLEGHPAQSAYKGQSPCRICGCDNGSEDISDGVWVWPSGLSHYVRTHSVKLPPEFLKHVYESPTGLYLTALSATREFQLQYPEVTAEPFTDSNGSPAVQAYIPKGVSAHHLPDFIQGIPIHRKEIPDGLPKGATPMASTIAPRQISEALLKIASSLESYEVPSYRLLQMKLRLLLATLEDDLTLTFISDPSASNDIMASDDGSIQDSVDLELMQAGAKSVDWDSDTLYVIVPHGSKVAVLEAFNSMKDGELGDDVSSFLSSLELSGGEPSVSVAHDVRKAASRIARRRKMRQRPERQKPSRTSKPVMTEDVLAPVTEFSCQVELSLTADFEGSVSKQKLLKKLRTELVAAIKTGVTVTAREYRLEPTGVHVKPIKVECAVNDLGSPEDEI